MDKGNKKLLLLCLLVLLVGFGLHFASYVASGRQDSPPGTRYDLFFTKKSIGPYYDAVLRFLGDSDLK